MRFTQERSRRRKAEKRLQAADIEFEAARRIQKKLLPAAPLALSGFDVAGLNCPAEATGGDYFDFVPMRGDAVGVVVGDVSGHGFGPALLMASTRAYLRAFAQTQEDLGELLSLVNRVLNLDMDEDRFVTLVLARLDPRTRSLVYTSAGHPTGYVLNASGQVRLRLPSTGPLLGPESGGRFSASPLVPLEAGEIVLLLTDGVIEASAPDNTAFGWDRAVHIVRVYRHDPAARIVSNLYHAVRAFTQNAPQLDDMTAVIIKVDGKGEPKIMSLENGVSTRGVETKKVLTSNTEGPMAKRCRAVAFDLDGASLTSLREALPEWEIEVVNRATTASLKRDWNLGAADLLVVNSHGEVAETLGLCRALKSQVGWAHTPLLVLVPSAEEALVRAVLKAGAQSCLVLPVHAKELAHMVTHSHEGNQPGRHTLNLHQAQEEDRWRDDGGQG